MTTRWTGILPPVTTPFASDGRLLPDALASNLERYQGSGISGVLALGSNGEAVHLSERERLQVVQVFQDCAGPLKLVVGVSEATTRGAIEFLDRISNGRVDALLVGVPNYYRNKMTGPAVIEYFSSLADISPFPVLLYNVPQYSGIQIEPAWVKELALHPNILGMKDSSGNLGYLQTVLACTNGASFQVILGSAQVLLASRVFGIEAGILALACAFPEWAVRILRVGLEDPETRSFQRSTFQAANLVTAEYGIAGLKYSMDLAGYRGEYCRRPLQALGDSDKAAIREGLAALLESSTDVVGRS